MIKKEKDRCDGKRQVCLGNSNGICIYIKKKNLSSKQLNRIFI